jgi:valyl-tRNA synthetase
MQPEPNHQQPVPDMEPRWEHTHHEQQISALWEQSGYYNPDVCIRDGICAPDAEPFCMVLPPPNVTGVLHIGHAAGLAIEDIMIRYARMNGKRTLWIPGTDSAAIATQSKVETEMYKKEDLTRSDVGRTEMIRRINAFVEQSKDTIISQTKAMGSSLDWRDDRIFTLFNKRVNTPNHLRSSHVRTSQVLFFIHFSFHF